MARPWQRASSSTSPVQALIRLIAAAALITSSMVGYRLLLLHEPRKGFGAATDADDSAVAVLRQSVIRAQQQQLGLRQAAAVDQGVVEQPVPDVDSKVAVESVPASWDEVEAVQQEDPQSAGLRGRAPPPHPQAPPAHPQHAPAATGTGSVPAALPPPAKPAPVSAATLELARQAAAAAAKGSGKRVGVAAADPFAAGGNGKQAAHAHSSGFGSEADLAHHKSNNVCWSHFDFGMLETWDAAATAFCVPDPAAAFPAQLTCRVTVDEHLPPATAPHTMCDGENISLDFTKLSPVNCLLHRPGYKCDGEPVFYRYAPGALSGACTSQPPFQAHAFPRDHLMDIFTSWASGTAADDAVASDAPVTLFVTRERAEHANMFHATTDMLNAFFTLHAAGIIDGLTGDRDGMQDVQVVLLDEQKGPFEDSFYAQVFSPQYPVQRVSSMLAAGRSRVRFSKALFVPPGYTNMLLAHVSSEGDCHAGTQLFQSYRRFVLSGFGYQPDAPAAAEAPLRVSFISRRPYTKYVEHNFIGRQVDNEEDLLAAMASLTGLGAPLEVTRYDFAQLEVRDQLAAIVQTDVLVGMHGAALTYALYLPHHAGVLELWPKQGDMWRCFEHTATMAGLVYHRWENPNPAAFRTDSAGDYTRVDVPSFLSMFHSAASEVLRRRNSGKDHHT